MHLALNGIHAMSQCPPLFISFHDSRAFLCLGLEFLFSFLLVIVHVTRMFLTSGVMDEKNNVSFILFIFYEKNLNKNVQDIRFILKFRNHYVSRCVSFLLFSQKFGGPFSFCKFKSSVQRNTIFNLIISSLPFAPYGRCFVHISCITHLRNLLFSHKCNTFNFYCMKQNVSSIWLFGPQTQVSIMAMPLFNSSIGFLNETVFKIKFFYFATESSFNTLHFSQFSLSSILSVLVIAFSSFLLLVPIKCSLMAQ